MIVETQFEPCFSFLRADRATYSRINTLLVVYYCNKHGVTLAS